MTKLLMAFVLFTACTASAFGQAYEQCIEITQNLLSYRKIEADRCQNLPMKSLEDLPKCYMDFHQNISERSCFPAMRATFKVLHFIWQQQYITALNFSSGIIDGNQFDDQWKRGLSTLMDETRSGANSMTRELRSISQAQADAYTTSRVNNAMAILGWLNQQNNTRANNPFKTYIINGKTINCTDLGSIIQCN